jgi:peptide/nickel transport system substrate-binding protein
MGYRERMAVGILAGIGLLSLALSCKNLYVSYTKAVPAHGGQYREGMLGQPRLINPLLASSVTDTTLLRAVFSGLYKYDGNGDLVPDLAESLPVISEDQKNYTIALKSNVKWHNDRPFTADDVIFTIKTLQDPDFKSPLRNDWANTTVEKIDDRTLVFKNRDISGPFVHHLTLPILPKHIWGKVDAANFVLANTNIEAIGTGPYAIKEIRKLPTGKIETITLESFSNYYGGKANIDTVIFVFYDDYETMANALHSRELDGLGLVATDAAIGFARTDVQKVRLPLPQYQAVFFNVQDKIMSDTSLRQALALATDRQEIIDNVFNGQAQILNGPLVGNQRSPSSVSIADLDQGNSVLDKGGWKINPATGLRGKRNVPLEVTLTTNDSPINSHTAELIKRQWEALHLTVNLQILPTAELTETVLRPRNFSALLFAQRQGADADPFAFWHSSQIKDPGLNLTGFSNQRADTLISEARSTTEESTRTKNYEEFAKLLTEQVPAVFLNQNLYIYAIDQKVKGISAAYLHDPSFRLYDLPNWYIEERRVWK